MGLFVTRNLGVIRLSAIDADVGTELTKDVINPLKTNDRPLYLKAHSVPRCKHFSSRL